MRRLQERHPIVTDFGPNESQERPMKAGQILLRSSERFTPATDEEISKYRDESYPEWIAGCRSEEHTSELQSLMRISYAVFCLKNKKKKKITADSTLQSIMNKTI